MIEKLTRGSEDGPMSVRRDADDTIVVEVEHNGVNRHLQMSEWNARRVFASLSLILQIPLSKAAGKIEMGGGEAQAKPGPKLKKLIPSRAKRHVRGGNCLENQDYLMDRGEGNEVCNRHYEPRGRCSQCPPCVACDLAKPGAR